MYKQCVHICTSLSLSLSLSLLACLTSVVLGKLQAPDAWLWDFEEVMARLVGAPEGPLELDEASGSGLIICISYIYT